MAKLFLFKLVIFVAFIAISDAAFTLITYTNSTCTESIAYHKSTAPCEKKKRSDLGVCYNDGDTYYYYTECNGDPVSNTVLPADWQYMTFNTEPDCNFTTSYNQLAVKYPHSTIVIYDPAGSNVVVNSSVQCTENGILSFSICVPALGCLTADSVPENVCTNITDGILGRPFNGIQTTCIAPPVAPPMTPPVAAPIVPVAAPVAAPKAATAPVKKSSDAVSIAVGSVALVAATASLFW